jgi:hypothetical protein
MASGHSLSATQSRTIALARVLGLEETVRVQDPDLFTTSGKHPQYYIRPWIDTFDQQGQPTKLQKRIYLGRTAEISRRDALKKKAEIMARINRTQVVLQAQVRFGEVLDYYLSEFVHNPEKLSASTGRNTKTTSRITFVRRGRTECSESFGRSRSRSG